MSTEFVLLRAIVHPGKGLEMTFGVQEFRNIEHRTVHKDLDTGEILREDVAVEKVVRNGFAETVWDKDVPDDATLTAAELVEKAKAAGALTLKPILEARLAAHLAAHPPEKPPKDLSPKGGVEIK